MSRDLIDVRVSLALDASPVLQSAVIAESGLMELLSLAASCDDPSARWEHYEKLKAAASGYVGWQAEKETLRTTGAYEAFTRALDELLPAPLEEIA